MQTKRSIYKEGEVVYAKSEGGGKTKLYIQEARNSTYILRTNKAGGGILQGKEFSDADLRETPWN